MKSQEASFQVGTGEYAYDVIGGFGHEFIEADVAGVAVDSQDRVYVLNRSDKQPILVFEPDGTLITSWGAGLFRRAHALLRGPDDSLYCIDDQGHSLRKFRTDGELVLEIETSDSPADTGYAGTPPSVVRSGPPFNTPTGVALSPDGDIIVSDGYGNARIHRFTAAGEFVSSFGEPGSGPGEFLTPHGVAVDQDGKIYVADRENSRVQVFTSDGAFIAEWRSPRASCMWIDDDAGTVTVTEMGEVMQGKPGEKKLVLENAPPGITVRNKDDGEILAHLPPRDPKGDGLYFSPHSIARDSMGNFYVSEVSTSYSGGLAPDDRPRVSKYLRRR